MAGSADITAINKAWKKIQTGVAEGFNVECEEIGLLKNLAPMDQPLSFRSNEVVIDLNEEGGIASILEGDYEAEEGSVGLEEYSISAQHFIGRFSLSNLAKYADKGSENQLERDLKLRAAKKVQALSSHVADYFYGSSSGVLALTDTDVTGASATLTLKSAYGNANLTDKAYMTRLFKAQDATGRGGDTIALVSGSALVAGSFGRVTARDLVNGTITVSFIGGSVTATTTDNLKVVKANSKGRQTIAHTDYNKGLVGLQDQLFATSLHGLTHENWAPAYADASAGAFSGMKIRRADNEIANLGSGKVDLVIMDQGVERNLIATERTTLRHMEAFGMEIDGSVKSEGRKFFTSRRVPAGWAIPIDKRAMKKWQVLPMPGNGVSWGDGKEYTDISGAVFRVETVLGLVAANRRRVATFTNQTRS